MKNSKKIITKISDLSDKQLQIGDIFTPVEWGEFAVQKFNLFDDWLNGASIFDPTMGEGNLLESLIIYGIKKGFSISNLPVQKLFGNELNTNHYKKALEKFKAHYGCDMSLNFTNEDILQLTSQKYDIIFGNPPWQNFVDLPLNYKERIKDYFFKYDLIGKKQNLLLGGSRIDIAALVIKVAIEDFLLENGKSVFFLPLSLFLNDGANKYFRTYKVNNIKYCVEAIYDFNNEVVFDGIATRYGLSLFRRDKINTFPVQYFRKENNEWTEYKSKPLFHDTDPLSIFRIDEELNIENFQPVILKKESTPRQGVNTCGANHIYFFDKYLKLGSGFVEVSNKILDSIILPEKFVYPLLTAQDFQDKIKTPNKWVLLPYNENGRPLEWSEILSYPKLKLYLEQNEDFLKNRKGVMLNALIKRGHWWALLGVGEYNFYKYKVVWEAYGKSNFQPKVFDGLWQANQSLQAFIPIRTHSEAVEIQKFLSNKYIEDYLLSLKMEGTMNWAQPGKIKKFIQYEEEALSLF